MQGSYKVAFSAVILATAVLLTPRAGSAQGCPNPPVGVGQLQVAQVPDDWARASWVRRIDFRFFSMHGWGRGAITRLGTRSASAVLRERRGLTR